MKKVNRDALARHLVKTSNLSLKESRHAVDMLLGRIEKAIEQREIVELRGIGTIRWFTKTTKGNFVKDRVRLRPSTRFRGKGNGKHQAS